MDCIKEGSREKVDSAEMTYDKPEWKKGALPTIHSRIRVRRR